MYRPQDILNSDISTSKVAEGLDVDDLRILCKCRVYNEWDWLSLVLRSSVFSF
jgi:hypothetical protein